VPNVEAFGLGDVVGDAAEELLRGLDEVAGFVFGEVATFEDDASVVGEEESLRRFAARGFRGHGRSV
jgi:hypothetical protein